MTGLNWKSLASAALAGAIALVHAGGAAADISDPLALRDHLYMPHFSKAAGIYEGLDQRGEPMTAGQREKGHLAQSLHADYSGPAAAAVTVAYWEGREEGEGGRWSAAAFEAYVDRVRAADEEIFLQVDAAASAMRELGFSASEAYLEVGRAFDPSPSVTPEAAGPGTDPALRALRHQLAELVARHGSLAQRLDAPSGIVVIGESSQAVGRVGDWPDPDLVSWMR